MNQWITHVKEVQRKNGCTYKEALKIASKSYKKHRGVKGKGFLDTLRNIGSNAGKSFPINPFDLGYTLGHDVIAPELKKIK